MTSIDPSYVSVARTTRRCLIQGAGAVAAAMLPVSRLSAAPAPSGSNAFVLVHGAWHGGWCWRHVAELLRKAGHTVFTPTLTGCGERLHLASTETNLQTHVTDILAMLHFEDINDIVLVGHSYAGLVISQVASEAAERMRSLIFLDAFVPDPGQSFADLIGKDVGEFANRGSVAPMLTLEDLGILDPSRQAFVADRLTPHPEGALEQKVAFNAETLSAIPRTFIQTSDLFSMEAERAASMGFYIDRISGAGHDVMITHPAQLARVLLDAAEGSHHAG